MNTPIKAPEAPFHESRLWSTPIRDLRLKIEGTPLEPVIAESRPEPFSRRFVMHLPGWYAQKHPDEDWAETFAVWMTPGSDWRKVYAAWPEALKKLDYCDSLMRELRDREPVVTDLYLDEE